MTWSYRVRRTDDYYELVEAYYADDGSVQGTTERAVPVLAESVEELRSVLGMMLRALDEEVLQNDETPPHP